ncbi:MAG: MBL fold metallo-hydrolase [Kofleriaceae bacterium]
MRWLGLALALVGAGCGPRFAGVGPSGVGAELSIDEVALRWSKVYLLRSGDRAMVVDAGSPTDCEDLGGALLARGVVPRDVDVVVVTHAHADHAGCAAWFGERGVAVVLGAEDVADAGRGRNQPLRATGLLAAALAPIFMMPFRGFTPAAQVSEEGDLAAWGWPEVHVIPVGAHTAGSLVVLAGGHAFVGDLIKGGDVFVHAPTEHLYHVDRLAAHRALRELLARGAARLYPGHSGPLQGAEVRAWLDGAVSKSAARAVTVQLEVRGERPRRDRAGDASGSAGVRLRHAWGRATGLGLGYWAGVDLRGGVRDGAEVELDGHPLGLVLRRGSRLLAGSAGVGLGGPRGLTASHATLELVGEATLGGVRVLARAEAGWVLGGEGYADRAVLGDELSASLGVRLGGDDRWGDYVSGAGPTLSLSYRDLGGVGVFGLAFGIELVTAEARR